MKKLYEELWAGSYRERKRDHIGRYYRFRGVVNPEEGSSFIDWGCGQGILGHYFHVICSSVQLIDIAENSLDPLVKGIMELTDTNITFINESITTATPTPAHYSACMDVLEHLEPKDVVPAVSNIIEHTLREAYFLVALSPDDGPYDGKMYKLHPTIRSEEWWFKLFEKFGMLTHRCLWCCRNNYPMLEVIIRL